MRNEIEMITIGRTAFIGPKSIKQAKKIIKKINSLKGEWYMAIVSKQANMAVELLLIEDGEVTDASYYEGKALQEAVKLTEETEDKFFIMEVA